jgi:hypothetical protein
MSSATSVFLREIGYGLGAGLIMMGSAKAIWYMANHHLPFFNAKPHFGSKRKQELVYRSPVFPHISDVEGRKKFFADLSKQSISRWWQADKASPTGKEEHHWQQLKNDVQNELDRLMTINLIEDG